MHPCAVTVKKQGNVPTANGQQNVLIVFTMDFVRVARNTQIYVTNVMEVAVFVRTIMDVAIIMEDVVVSACFE